MQHPLLYVHVLQELYSEAHKGPAGNSTSLLVVETRAIGLGTTAVVMIGYSRCLRTCRSKADDRSLF